MNWNKRMLAALLLAGAAVPVVAAVAAFVAVPAIPATGRDATELRTANRTAAAEQERPQQEWEARPAGREKACSQNMPGTGPQDELKSRPQDEPRTGPQDEPGLVSLMERVNVQTDTARRAQIIDGEWVAVGIRKAGAICRDSTRMYRGAPSYRFTLGREDNTLEGYAPGETKGRAELSYCFATAADFARLDDAAYAAAQKMKTVYHHGKGQCPQGASRTYRFAVYIPSDLASDVSTIFAQWHGMPDRTLATAPTGEVRKLTEEEFLAMYDTVIIKKDRVFSRVEGTDRQGRTVLKAGRPTGWKIEQGGYPPLAFGFSDGWFYIKANSDRRWFTDKTDRCNANVANTPVMRPVTSQYKASTIAYKLPFAEFPKECWVEFEVRIDWTRYGREAETIAAPGRLDVGMAYDAEEGRVERRIMNNAEVLIGRNDDAGYYFKFGIYRVGGSSEPVSYNLAGYDER